jgi:hypothetical protein
MPMYAQGTVIPDISDLMYRNSDCGRIGRLLRFQGLDDHGLVGCVSRVGAAL